MAKASCWRRLLGFEDDGVVVLMGIWLPEGVASSASINTMRIQRKESIFRAEVNLIISKTAFSRVSVSSLHSKDGCRPRFLAFSWSLSRFHPLSWCSFLCSAKGRDCHGGAIVSLSVVWLESVYSMVRTLLHFCFIQWSARVRASVYSMRGAQHAPIE